MPVRWHGHCKLLDALPQLPVGRRGQFSQAQTRCNAQFRTFQDRLDTGTSFNDLAGVRSSRVVAARKYDGRSKPFEFVAPQKNIESPFESAVTNHAQRDPEPGAYSMLKDLEATDEATRSSSMDLASQLKRKSLRFAIQERGKENRLLVNQLLKDKGRLSYDWRVPVELLEQHYKFPNAQPPNTDVSLFRNVVTSDDTASEHQGRMLIQRIKTRNPKEAKLAREITMPSVWSEVTLADYVEDLVEYEYHKDAISRVSQHPDKGTSNIADITTALYGIFSSPTTKRYLSIQAYKTALGFFYDHGLFSRVRDLYIQMDDSRMDIPTEIFNLVLRGSASSRDLHNFTFILQKCIQRGFKPDIETWNVLLTTISSSEIRAVIIQRMWERGVLDSLPREGNALRLIVQQEIGFHIDKRGDRGAFLDYMDDRYGKTWLTTSTGNKLLYEFGKRRSMSETLNLLPGMKLRRWIPDEISLDTLLRQSLLLRQHKYAVEILENFRCHFGLKPGKQAHETLFLLAWRSRLLNFARVVWASACTCGYVTFKMRNFVFQSLLSRTAVQPSDGRAEKFKRFVGRFVVGVNRSKEVVPLGPGGISEAQGPITRRSIVKYAQMLLQSDLLAAGSSRIQEDLGKLLLQALELDMEWVRTKLLSVADLQLVLQIGLQIRQVVPYSQRRRLRIRQHIARETQKARVIRKVGNSVGIHEPTRSLARSDYAGSFQQMKVVRLRRTRGLRIRRLVVSLQAKAERPKGTFAPAVEKIVSPLNLRYVQSAEKIERILPVIQKDLVGETFRNSIAGSIKQKRSARLSTRKLSVGSVRRKLRNKKPSPSPSPSTDAVFPVPPLIRNIPSGDASLKVSTDSFVEKPRIPPAGRKLSSDRVENDPTPRPVIRKPLAAREEPISRPLRKHLAIVYWKHQIAPGVRKAAISSKGKKLSAPLKNAHIHSSLDKVLDLSEALDKGAKSNKSNAIEDKTTSLQTRLADRGASSTQEAPSTVRVRRCPPREHPYSNREIWGFPSFKRILL